MDALAQAAECGSPSLVTERRAPSMHSGLINHLDLTVTDLAVSCDFYDKVLGRLGYLRSSEYAGEVPCWVLSRSGATLSIGLHEATASAPHDRYSAGLHHLAFHLSSREEVDSFHEFLLQESITVLDAPAEYDYTPGYYAVFFCDPDGIKLELVYEPRFLEHRDSGRMIAKQAQKGEVAK